MFITYDKNNQNITPASPIHLQDVMFSQESLSSVGLF